MLRAVRPLTRGLIGALIATGLVVVDGAGCPEVAAAPPVASSPAAPSPAPSPSTSPSTSPSGVLPSPAPSEPARSPAVEPAPKGATGPITAAEKKAISAIIVDLYRAYARADLDAVMKIEHEAIEASALDAERRGMYKAEQVRSAFLECHRDVLTHKDFKMKPLHTDGLRYVRKGGQILVRSDEPVIATEKVHLKESDMDVRLTISRFLFKRQGETYRIVQMNLL